MSDLGTGWERVEVFQPAGSTGSIGHQRAHFASEAGIASAVGNHRLAGPGLRRRWNRGSAASVASALRQLSLVPHSCRRQPSNFSKTYWQKSQDPEPRSKVGATILKLTQLSTEFGFTKTSPAPTNCASGAKDAKRIATDEFKPNLRPSISHLPADRMLSGQKPGLGWRLTMLSGG
jgi:hypothetical protein